MCIFCRIMRAHQQTPSVFMQSSMSYILYYICMYYMCYISCGTVKVKRFGEEAETDERKACAYQSPRQTLQVVPGLHADDDLVYPQLYIRDMTRDMTHT
jgi:hypothetical protein